jgi:hypothetical protein
MQHIVVWPPPPSASGHCSRSSRQGRRASAPDASPCAGGITELGGWRSRRKVDAGGGAARRARGAGAAGRAVEEQEQQG